MGFLFFCLSLPFWVGGGGGGEREGGRRRRRRKGPWRGAGSYERGREKGGEKERRLVRVCVCVCGGRRRRGRRTKKEIDRKGIAI